MEELQTAGGFKNAYLNRLTAILRQSKISAHQLVLGAACAIALRDETLLEVVKRNCLAQDLANSGGTDDEHTLNYINNISNPLNLIHQRRTRGGWLIQFNEIRSLRPKGESKQPVTNLYQAFDDTKFNFNKVLDEMFWDGHYHNRHIQLFYNKFPINAYHSLLVPDASSNQEQFLQPADHALAWDIQSVLSRQQPRLVIGYNAYGAGASINHLHFQVMPQAPELLLLAKTTPVDYPIPVATFETPDRAWRHIHRLQSENRTFNIIYVPGRVHVIERAYQGQYQSPSWNSCFAWFELLGGIICLEERAYQTLTEDQILAVFADITPR